VHFSIFPQWQGRSEIEKKGKRDQLPPRIPFSTLFLESVSVVELS
jgi:hypothetical protein